MALFNFLHKNDGEVIVVSPNSDYIVWTVDISKCDRNARYAAGNGVKVVKLVNGQYSGTDIKNASDAPSRLFERNENAENVKLVAMNITKEAELRWGIGDLHFRDRATGNVEDQFGLNGTVTIQTPQFAPFIERGHLNLTAAEFKKEILTMTQGIVRDVFLEKTARLRYTDLSATLSQIEEDAKDRLQDAVEEKRLNIRILDFAIAGHAVSDEFAQKMKNGESDTDILLQLKKKREEEQEKKKEQKREEAFYEACSGSIPVASASRKAEPAQFCPRCGTEREDGATVCSKCGKKL